MVSNFPTRTESARIAEIGVNAVSVAFNDGLGWLFARNHGENDFGIDGYIYVVGEDGEVTGQSIAIQIKTGESYFSTQDEGSVTFYGQTKHLNYYLNSQVPVLIILCNPKDKECLWEEFLPERTAQTGSGWKIPIPKRNVLGPDSKEDLLRILGPVEDFTSELKEHWMMNELLEKSQGMHYAVPRESIEGEDISGAEAFFHRLRSSNSLCRKLQGKVELSISGYDFDDRELWEVPEVRVWFEKADQYIQDWFFFLRPSKSQSSIKLYFSCMCGIERMKESDARFPGKNVIIDNQQMANLFTKNWPRLNDLTSRLGMSIEENKRISISVMRIMGIPCED